MTFTSLLRARNCMLNGPVIFSADATSRAIFLILRIVSMYRRCGGSTSVASPECTPAFSTCSEMAHRTISPSSATASTSTSFEFCSNLVITTGCSGDTSAARVR